MNTIHARLDRFHAACAALPPPGCGRGCHTALLGAANLGRMAGLTPEEVAAYLARALPTGRRLVSDREIADAVAKAFACRSFPRGRYWGDIAKPRRQPQRQTPAEGARRREDIIRRGGSAVAPDRLAAASPVPLGPPAGHAALLLRHLYAPGEMVYCGTGKEAPREQSQIVRAAADWASYFESRTSEQAELYVDPEGDHVIPVPIEAVQTRLQVLFGGATEGEPRVPVVDRLQVGPTPHICVNPLWGEPRPTACGTTNSYRSDRAVAVHRYAVAEFDSVLDQDGTSRVMPIEEQLAFWAGSQMPVAALIDSGQKSIHAWLPVRVAHDVAWRADVRDYLFGKVLVPMGLDGSCSNPSRLSRLPGVKRSQDRWQRLLWLAPGGRTLP